MEEVALLEEELAALACGPPPNRSANAVAQRRPEGIVGGGAGVVAGSSGWTHPDTTVVVGAGGRHGAEAGTQAREPPRPLAGSGVNPTMYLAFCASGSAFQRWPGAWQGGLSGSSHRGRGRAQI